MIFFLHDNLQKASFNLVKNNISHSRFLRTKYLPMVFMPLIIIFLGISANLPDLLFFKPNIRSSSFLKTSILIMSPSIIFTLIMCTRLLVSNTKIADSSTSATSWIYESLPVRKRKSILLGSFKFIYTYFIIPLMFIILLLLSFIAPVEVVLLNIIFTAAAIYFIASVNLLFDKTLPFTLESSGFSSASKFMEIFLSMLIGVILFLIQILIFQNTIFVLLSIAALILISFALNRI